MLCSVLGWYFHEVGLGLFGVNCVVIVCAAHCPLIRKGAVTPKTNGRATPHFFLPTPSSLPVPLFLSFLSTFSPLFPSFSSFPWQRGSVVRTSIFGCRTFPDLCLIYGWHVTTSWVMCPLWVNQPGNSAFHPSEVGKWVVIHVITWVETIKRQTRAAYGWLVVGQSVGAGLA